MKSSYPFQNGWNFDSSFGFTGSSSRGMKKGGSTSKKDWIQGAVKKPGALTSYVKSEGVKMKDGKIPKGVINKLASGKQAKTGAGKPSETTQKRANLAKTFSKICHIES